MLLPNRTHQEFDFALGSDFLFSEDCGWIDEITDQPNPARRGFWTDEELTEITGYSVSQLKKILSHGGACGYKAKKPGGGYKRVWVRPEAFRVFLAIELSRMSNLNIEISSIIIKCLDQFARQYGEKLDVFHEIAELVRSKDKILNLESVSFRIILLNNEHLLITQNDLCADFHQDKLVPFATIRSKNPISVPVFPGTMAEGFVYNVYNPDGNSYNNLPEEYSRPTTRFEIDIPKVIYPLVKGAWDDAK